MLFRWSGPTAAKGFQKEFSIHAWIHNNPISTVERSRCLIPSLSRSNNSNLSSNARFDTFPLYVASNYLGYLHPLLLDVSCKRLIKHHLWGPNYMGTISCSSQLECASFQSRINFTASFMGM